ncbi:hypothetical protein TMEN_8791 [Trichophyton mentagrophytes]|nr:hypothetical protein TMEN_8791 [Trichophyton mentagrophytes]
MSLIGALLKYLLTGLLDISLAYRKQFNLIRDSETRVVTKVKYLEPLPLRKTWMNDLAWGVAFLESLNLAHGDLRPEDILLDRNRLKISDFDCTSEFGTGFDTCPCSYRRPLNSEESDQEVPGTAVYGGQRIADDPYEHGSKVMELLQDMKFPELNGDPLIDDIIDKCWRNRYCTLAGLTTLADILRKESTSEPRNYEATSTLDSISLRNNLSLCTQLNLQIQTSITDTNISRMSKSWKDINPAVIIPSSLFPPLERAFEEEIQAVRREEGVEAFGEEEKAAVLAMFRSMLVFDPEKRASAKSLLASDWMMNWGLPGLKCLRDN